MNRPLKALNRWRSELWECQYYAGKRGVAIDRRDFKRGARRARRRVSKTVALEQSLG